VAPTLISKFPKFGIYGNFDATILIMSRDEKRTLFEHLLLLRRASRELPLNRDLATVRAYLEGQLGETMSLRMAAELLGVSHTALQRWIARGDLPTVFTPRGRNEIPVDALLDLRESTDHARLTGGRGRHVLEPAMTMARDRAERLQPDTLVSDLEEGEGHRPAELRGLAYHRAIAQRLRRADVDEARRIVWKWRGQGRIDPRYAEEWDALLSGSMAEIKQALGDDSAHMRDMRQNSPFAGLLSEAERRRVLDAVR
jgi:hypothetical protein